MEYAYKIIIKIIVFIIISLYYNINLISKFNNFISYISFKKEVKEMDNYLNICKNFKIIKKFKIKSNTKISIISPIYNRERFIYRFLTSIQFQDFTEIEIILIDDCSIDNSVKIIEDYKKKDERIILIKNKNNKGTFMARNIGVLYAKGKYIILPDPDDILLKGIISFCYNNAEKFNYEIIRFTTYDGNEKLGYAKYVQKLGNKPVYFPLLSTNIFYGYGELEMIDYSINNKFIKTKAYIKALNSLNNFYFNMHMIYLEDQLMNYILLTKAKSFYFSKRIGYYYLKNEMSITKNKKKMTKIRIKFIFIYIMIVFEYSKNTKYEKDMFNHLFTQLNKLFNIENDLANLSSKEDLNFYYYIINLYLNCKFITNENKYYSNYLKKIIKNK
jgi:glycosyltransferase involved in cell wall biosynthesis